MKSTLHWWLSVCKNTTLALQPFSAPARKTALQVLTKRLLQAQDVSDYSNLIWPVLAQTADTISFRRGKTRWTGSVQSVITRSLFESGGYQSKEIEMVLQCLPSHFPDWPSRKVIVNIGANIGDTCIPLALQTGKTVIAAEPVPDTFALLCRNVADNGLESRIRCRQVAVSDVAGSVAMTLTSDLGQSEVEGVGGKQGYAVDHYDRGSIDVAATTLDALITAEGFRAEDVALIWSDTQGYESQVLESGTQLWAAGTPAWVELWPNGLEAHGGVDRFIDTCCRNFRHFVASSTEGVECRPRPTGGELRKFSESIRRIDPSSGMDFADVLLLP
jgi:FkbM family methyltransferase